MVAKFEISLDEALRQIADFQLRMTALGKNLDDLQTKSKKGGSAAKQLLTEMDTVYTNMQQALAKLVTGTGTSSNAVDAAFKRIRQSAEQTFQKIGSANLDATVKAQAYSGALADVGRVMEDTAKKNTYAAAMQKIAVMQEKLLGDSKVMQTQLDALATAQGKVAVQLRERLASETRIAASATKQQQTNKELQNQLAQMSSDLGKANSQLEARVAALSRAQQEETKLNAKLEESRRAYASLTDGIQKEIAIQSQLNAGVQQAATFRDRELNQLAELQRRQQSLNGGTAEQIASVKAQNAAREAQLLTSTRYLAQIETERARLQSLNGGQAEELARLKASTQAREAQIKGEEKYTQSLAQMTAAQAQQQAQEETAVRSMRALNEATLAAARSQSVMTKADAEAIALGEKLAADTRAQSSALLDEARSAYGMSKAQQELNQQRERSQSQISKLIQQRELLSGSYGKETAQLQAQIREQEALNRLRAMSIPQLLGFTSAQEKHNASLNAGAQLAASLRAGLSGLGTSFGMYTSGTILAASATYTFFRAMKDTVSLGAEFTASLATANAVMNSNNPSWLPDNFKSMETQVRALGQTTVFTASEVAKGLIDLGQAGLSSAEALLALRPTLDLAQIGNVSMSESADMATNVMMTFGKEASDLTRIVDIMASAAVDSNTDVRQLANALTYAGPAAHAAGISLEETTAAVEVLSNSGIKASRAGTALRKLFTSLLNPTKKGAEVLEQYNIATQNVDGSTRNLSDIVSDLNKELMATGVTEAQRLTAIQNLVGLYATSPVSALVSNSKQLKIALDNLEYNVAGAAERMRAKMSDTLQVDWKNTLSAYEELQLQVYDKFEAYLRATTARITTTLLELTQPVKVLLNTDASTQSIQQLVDKANQNGGSYSVKTDIQGTVSAIDAKGQQVGMDQLVASMDSVSKDSVTVISQLDLIIERVKDFAEAGALLATAWVGNKLLTNMNIAFTGLSQIAGELATRTLAAGGPAVTLSARVNSLRTSMMASLVQAKVWGSGVSSAMISTARAGDLMGASLLGFNAVGTIATRTVQGLAIAAAGLTRALGFIGLIGSIGYAIYTAFGGDNEKALADHAKDVVDLNAEYKKLNQEMDQLGVGKERQAIQEQIDLLQVQKKAIEAKNAQLIQTNQIYQDAAKARGIDASDNTLTREIAQNEQRLQKIVKDLAGFYGQIGQLGTQTSTTLSETNDKILKLNGDIAKQKLEVTKAFGANIIGDETGEARKALYDIEVQKLKELENQMIALGATARKETQDTLSLAQSVQAAFNSSLQAAGAAFQKKSSPGETLDQTFAQLRDLKTEIDQLESQSEKSGVGAPALQTKLTQFAEAQKTNFKALADFNDLQESAQRAQLQADLAGGSALEKKVIYQKQLTDLAAEQQQINGLRANGNSFTADERQIKLNQDLATAKNGLASVEKTLTGEENKRGNQVAKFANQYDDFIGQQDAATKAALGEAAAYASGSNAVSEYAIQQQLANEVLKLENANIHLTAEQYVELEAAIRKRNAAEQERDVEKSIESLKRETTDAIANTQATLDGEAALRAYNVQKQFQQMLEGKDPAIKEKMTKAAKEASTANEQALYNKGLAEKGKDLIETYNKGAVYARDYAKEVESIDYAYANGKFTQDEYTKAIKGVTDEYENNKASLTVWGKLTTDELDRIDQSFVSMWENIGQGFGEFSDSLLDGFKKLLASLAHEAITKPILISFTNTLLGTNKSGGISDVWNSLTGSGSSSGSLGGAKSLIDGISTLNSLSTSNFGQALSQGWAGGEGLFGGLKGLATNGYNFVAGSLSPGLAGTSAQLSGALADSYAGYGSQFLANAGESTVYFPSAAAGTTTGTTAAGAAGGGSTVGNAFGSAGSVFAGIGGAIQGYQQNGLKGAVVTGLSTYAGAALGSAAATAAGAAAGIAAGATLGSVVPVIGTIIGAALGAAFGGKVFGGDWVTKDQGIQLAVNDGDLDAYNFEYQKKKGGLFSSNKKRTKYSPLDSDYQAGLEGALASTAFSSVAMFTQLGVDVQDNVFDNFSFALRQISTKGKTSEEITAEVTKYFSDVGDAMVKSIAEATGEDSLLNYTFAGLQNFVQVLFDVNAILEKTNVKMVDFNVSGGHMTEALVALAGGMDNLNTASAAYYDKFISQNEKNDDTILAVARQFQELNVAFPATREGFKSLVESMDITTETGRQMYLTLLNLSTGADAAYTILESRAAQVIADSQAYQQMLGSNVEAAIGVLQTAIDHQKDLLEASYQKTVDGINTQIDDLNTSLQDMTSLVTSLDSALKTLRGTNDDVVQMLYAQGRETLKAALATVQGGGKITDFDGLQDAIDAVSQNTMDSYHTLQDYLYDQGVNAGLIEQLGDNTSDGVDKAQETINKLKDQLKVEKDAYDAQIKAWDDQVQAAKDTLSALNGIDTSVKSVEEAMSLLNDSIMQALLGTDKDGTKQSHANNLKEVISTYKAVLGRDADSAGAEYWANQLDSGKVSLKDLAQAIASSAGQSANNPYGDKDSANNYLKGVINSVYQSVLGHGAEAAGSDYWMGQLQSGKVSIADLETAIRNAAQGAGQSTSTPTAGAAAPVVTPQSQIAAAYQQYLGRGVDSAGSDYWLSQVAAGKLTLDQAIQSIASSQEAATKGGKFATGASFTNSVVTRPTSFSLSEMGEDGPEAILPLTNVGGKLGVSANVSSDGTGGSDNSQLIALLDRIDGRLKLIALSSDRIEKHTNILETWDQTGMPGERE